MHQEVISVISMIKNAGVVGAGGGGFPTHVKVSATADTIVVNGAECEPLLRVDQQLMDIMAVEMIKGLEIVMGATGAREGIIALKSKYTKALSALEKLISNKPIRVYILDDFYPAGDEHVTLYEAAGRLIPQGAIPLKVGCIVINVETLINVFNAINGKPVTHSYLTVTGEVATPLTVKMPIGATIKEALELAGVRITPDLVVIDGGPMMGKIVDNIEQPVTKTTKGLIVLTEEHQLVKKRRLSPAKIIKQTKAACIQCRYCTDLCPRYLLGHELEPHKIMRSIRNFKNLDETMKMALICSECGVCEQYACIMQLSPKTINAVLKQEFWQKGIKPNDLSKEQQINKIREHRKIPVKRLVSRLGLTKYDVYAPLIEKEVVVDKVSIKLKQHAGAPSVPIVKAGQLVQLGDMIASVPENALGANIHASINGEVTEITDDSIIITKTAAKKGNAAKIDKIEGSK